MLLYFRCSITTTRTVLEYCRHDAQYEATVPKELRLMHAQQRLLLASLGDERLAADVVCHHNHTVCAPIDHNSQRTTNLWV